MTAPALFIWQWFVWLFQGYVCMYVYWVFLDYHHALLS